MQIIPYIQSLENLATIIPEISNQKLKSQTPGGFSEFLAVVAKHLIIVILMNPHGLNALKHAMYIDWFIHNIKFPCNGCTITLKANAVPCSSVLMCILGHMSTCYGVLLSQQCTKVIWSIHPIYQSAKFSCKMFLGFGCWLAGLRHLLPCLVVW